MPEPPKITTSLADRIARLNATQAHSLDRNHAQVQEQIGEIKSKISKYEATGQHEAPLIPKGSFGLGAPLARPDRGLDRMRIASLGVSGGTTVSIKSSPSNSLSASTGPTRSVSLGRPDSRRLSNLSSSDQHSRQSSPTHSPSQPLPSEQLPTPPQETQDTLGEQGAARTETTKEDPQDPSEDQEANNSFDSAEAYDGILDGYPTTPAEEDCPPMVTCSNCSRSVELELLGDHVCEQSLPPSKAQSPTERSPEGARRPPADVPVDAVESPALVISQDHPEEPPKDQQPPLSPSSSVCSSSKRTHDPSTTNNNTTTTTTNTHLSPAAGPPEPLRPPTPVICNKEKDLDSTHQSNKQGSPEILSPKEPQLQANNRLSDSSHSTNTTRLSTGPIPPSSASAGRRSWYNDDDDPDYYDNENAPTGFVTIVRSSKRI
ncbi:hypothetical protein PGT21_028790 [Puccinia graminis f. sp. tritici]|uniref:Uncharacterized protein n=1 Tax=Puccinia graminis f. sp. tritici TaxID=56615 RepID=A0A5B0LYV4_PUCGR|nr:hypothetical protein PGT21_028790 [Puccinia graminis f. sp. tritici]